MHKYQRFFGLKRAIYRSFTEPMMHVEESAQLLNTGAGSSCPATKYRLAHNRYWTKLPKMSRRAENNRCVQFKKTVPQTVFSPAEPQHEKARVSCSHSFLTDQMFSGHIVMFVLALSPGKRQNKLCSLPRRLALFQTA